MSEKTSVEELISRAAMNDQRCQEMLYKQFHGFGMSVALRYCQTREEAVEVLNDAFIKVFSKGEKYDPKIVFKVWFRRIIINTALDLYRKNKKHYHHADIADSFDVPSDFETPVEKLGYDELLKVINQLPKIYKNVFCLYVIDGYSHQEIAKQLEISEGTSKSNLSRARAMLRKMLTGQDTSLKPIENEKYGTLDR